MKKLLSIILMMPILASAWQPTKPVTVIFPNGPGAGNEISFRIVADQIERTGTARFIQDYRPGADGNVAMNHFATVPADGHTIAVPACQSNWVTPEIWYSNMVRYNANDFEPVATIAKSPLAFWANPKSTVTTPKDLISEIREKKRPLVFAIGGGGHKLVVTYLTDKLAVPGGDLVETVMYKGPAQALVDVMGGHAEFGVTPVAVGWPFAQAGRLKLIGIANEHSLPGLESVPLMKNLIPGLYIHGCWNLVLPKGTPVDIQRWYADTFVPVIRNSESAEKFKANMMFTTANEHTPQGVRAAMLRLMQTWQPIARKIKPE